MSKYLQQEEDLFSEFGSSTMKMIINVPGQGPVPISVPKDHPLIIGSKLIDWEQMAKDLDPILYKGIRKFLGRHLDVRAHCGMYLLKAMHNWTDRFSEEMNRYYAPARIFCGYDPQSKKSIDHTRIEKFRNRLGKLGAEVINKYLLQEARNYKFTDGKHVDMDTAVQEAGITHPTEMKLMKKFRERAMKLVEKISGATSEKSNALKEKSKEAKKILKEYQFFAKTKEKKDKLIEKTWDISLSFLESLKGLSLTNGADKLRPFLKKEMQHLLTIMPTLLEQIKIWLETGKVAKHKIVSLYKGIPRFISKGKIGKKFEIGRKWIINQLAGGYLLLQCPENPNTAETDCVKISLQDIIRTFGEIPESYGTDRGMDSKENIKRCERYGIKYIGIQPKGQKAWQVDREMAQTMYCRRAGIEPRIGIAGKLGLKKSRARTDDGDIISGFVAGLGFNLKKLLVSWNN